MKAQLFGSAALALLLVGGPVFAQTPADKDKQAPALQKTQAPQAMPNDQSKSGRSAAQSDDAKQQNQPKAAEDMQQSQPRKDMKADSNQQDQQKSFGKNGSAKNAERQDNERLNKKNAERQDKTTGRSASDPSMQRNDNKSEANRGKDMNAGGDKAASIDQQKQTRIRDALRNEHVENIKKADFDVRVGGMVPDHYRFNPLPDEVVSILPQYRGYDYIMADNEIIIVEPQTHKIVYTMQEGRSSAKDNRPVECR